MEPSQWIEALKLIIENLERLEKEGRLSKADRIRLAQLKAQVQGSTGSESRRSCDDDSMGKKGGAGD